MPTETDVKLADDLAEFRLEAEKRFGAVEKAIAEGRTDMEKRFGSVDSSLAGIQEQLKFVRWIGVFFAGILVAVVAGAGRVVWDAATTNAQVIQQGKLLEEVRAEVKQQGARLDAMDRKLDTLISRTTTKASN